MATTVIGAAQSTPVRGDVGANIQEHIRLVRLARQVGVRVLVFPELSLTGYELDLAEELAFVERDRRLETLREESARLVMTIVVGAPLRLEGQLHIAALIIPPDGCVSVYTKHHLGAFPPSVAVDGRVPPPEATVFVPGSRNPLIEVDELVGSVAICADIGRPTHARAAADRGSNAYLASTFVIPADVDGDIGKLQGYAETLGMAVVFSNFGGPSGHLPSAGRSALWSEKGELLVQLSEAGSGVAYASREPTGWRAGSAMLSHSLASS
jgi:predicted amidohydrolase